MELCPKRALILEEPGPLLVTGGPGSGKTTIALLKAKRAVPQLRPGQAVLFLSFSRAAVRQVLSRSLGLLSTRERSSLNVQTYHAFCLEVLEGHGRLLLGKPCRFLPPDQESLRKADFDGDWEVERSRLASDEGLVAFDCFAPSVASLFARATCVRELLGRKYPLVVVDEFQDTDDDQWRMLQELAKTSTLFCLADPDQRIFEYRGDVSAKRLEQLRQALHPKEVDLGVDNHRSPGSGILAFADAILKNESLTPTSDVSQYTYRPWMFDTYTHLAVLAIFSALRKKGIDAPTVAVLARWNSVVAMISGVLHEERPFKDKTLPAVGHDVLWDADLSAIAGQTVASIMERTASRESICPTLRLIALYYRMRNATKPSSAARGKSLKFQEAVAAIESRRRPALKAAKMLAASPVPKWTGDPIDDWKLARDILEVAGLDDIVRESRMVRLFRATDTIAAALAEGWVKAGTYAGASHLVKRILDRQRLLGSDRDQRGCTLMTIHKSKGKEFDGVVVIEHSHKGPLLGPGDEPAGSVARRLLRVAVTRARTHVCLVRPQGSVPLVSP